MMCGSTMTAKWLPALMLTAAAVGSLHTLAPDHWVPFAALARARGWTQLRTARITLLCGFGHVTVSALLGIVALFIGHEAVHAFGSTLEANASLLLIGFGVAYMTWGLWRNFRGRLLHEANHTAGVPHSHGGHHHHHHDHHRAGLTEWSLFLLFCVDPCVAVIPLIMAASGAGWSSIVSIVIVYEIATMATMVILVGIAYAGARVIRLPWLDRYGDVVAGALIICLGALVTFLGI